MQPAGKCYPVGIGVARPSYYIGHYIGPLVSANKPAMNPVKLTTIAALVLCIGCGSPAPSDDASPDDLVAELFAPGAISTEVPEFATTFSVTGDTVWFSRASVEFADLAIMRSIRSGDGWSTPDTVIHYPDAPVADPFMSHDGTRLYFSADLSGREEGGASWDTWLIQRVGNHWTAPMNVGSPPNTDSVDIFVSETLGEDLVFMSNHDGRRIYRADRTDDGWSEPVVLDIPDTQGRGPGNPLISPSGDALIFAMDADTAAADGVADLFVTCREEGGWSRPRALPEPVNSEYTDFAPGLGPNGELYFTSQRPGVVQEVPGGTRRPGDLYQTNLMVEELCP